MSPHDKNNHHRSAIRNDVPDAFPNRLSWENLHRISSLYAVILVLISVLVWVLIRQWIDPSHSGIYSWEAWLPLIDSLVAIIIVFGLTHIVSSERKELALKKLLEEILISREYLSSLSSFAKQQTIRDLLSTTVGNSLAGQIDEAFIAPNAHVPLKEVKRCLRYVTHISRQEEPFTLLCGDETSYALQEGMYYGVETKAEFVAPVKERWRQDGCVEIIFCLNEAQLNNAFDRETCLFRESVELIPDDCDALLPMLNREGASGLTVLEGGAGGNSCITSSCEINDVRSDRKGIRYDPQAGICILYSFPHTVAETITFKVTVGLPFSRINPCYPVVFHDPTEVNCITLHLVNIDSSHLACHPMLTVADQSKVKIKDTTANGKHMERDVHVGNQIVFPKSGVVFSWHDNAAVSPRGKERKNAKSRAVKGL